MSGDYEQTNFQTKSVFNVQYFVVFGHFNVHFHKQAVLFNSLANGKTLDLPKLKGFADDKVNMPVKLNFVSGRIENIVGKEENAGHQHFLLFLQCFQKPLRHCFKVMTVW